MNYYSNNFRPMIDYIERSSVYESYQSFNFDNLEKQKQEDIERFQYVFQTLLKDISTNLYKLSDDITVEDIVTNIIDLYNGYDENDDISFHFLGVKKKNERVCYNFYLKDCYIDSNYNDLLRINIVGYVWHKEYEMSLQISQEHLEMLRN